MVELKVRACIGPIKLLLSTLFICSLHIEEWKMYSNLIAFIFFDNYTLKLLL